MVMSKHMLILSLLLVLFELVSLPTTSCNRVVSFNSWVRHQPANATQDAGCAKKDDALSSANTIKVRNYIDPASELRPEDGGYTTISESIANIPDDNTKCYVLTLKPGVVFREKLLLGRSKPFLTIISEDPMNPAIIV
ncbi:Pectinesterase 1 [Zea mays]|jgi:pectinesterase|uniref:Pectinesterase n=2 Tax=Zea mays TaxID=4577 RepID=A0A1D6PR69_MAIZE|nr:pectinesterase [Zea mays]PWZ26533.1 Pectinesterase 1 [Zea mays]